MYNHYNTFVEINEVLIKSILAAQETNTLSPNYGAFLIPQKGFGEPVMDSNCISILLSGYYNQDSSYYHNEILLNSATVYLENLLMEQHDNGTLDLKETNFLDATSAAFAIQNLGYVYRLIEKYSEKTQKEQTLKDNLLEWLKKAAFGMKTGGIHTPNHRWVMSSALALCYTILKDEECKIAAQQYLNEGIDCDDEGEYTERSTGIYNVVNNRSLLIIADEFDMPELKKDVEKNLYMMLSYFEPDGSVFTLNSTRQDSDKVVYPLNYYENYLLMAIRTSNKEFAYVADYIFNLIQKEYAQSVSPMQLATNLGLITTVIFYLLDDTLKKIKPDLKKVDFSCHKFYRTSKIVRDIKDNRSYTILGNNSIFFVMQKGRNKIAFKFATSFYAKGVFVSPDIVKTDNGYKLNYQYTWGYKKALPHGSNTNDWHKMDHSLRENANVLTLDLEVLLCEKKDGMYITFKSNGVKNLPAKIEMIFPASGVYETPDIRFDGNAGSDVLLKNKNACYKFDDDTITIDGGFGIHNYTHLMRGSEQKMKNNFTVYCTDIGEFEHTLHIY